MSFIDSTGMSVIVGARRKLEEQGRQLVLHGLQRTCRRALVLAGLAGLLPNRVNPLD